jgi:hypothetical protein
MTVGRWRLWVVKREPVLELCGRCVYWVLRALKALEWEDLCGYEDTPVGVRIRDAVLVFNVLWLERHFKT